MIELHHTMVVNKPGGMLGNRGVKNCVLLLQGGTVSHISIETAFL
jgi:hypothetical protein